MTDSRQLTSILGSSATSRAACMRSPSSCRLPFSFSGLPGVTSHQTRSSCNRLSANWLIARWACCGGLNEPPSRPMRMPVVEVGAACATERGTTNLLLHAPALRRYLRPRLSGAVNAIFEAGQLLGTNRTTRVESAGGDADLR